MDRSRLVSMRDDDPMFARRETDEEREQLDWLYEPAEREYAPIHPEPAWRSALRKLWAPIAVLGGLLLKFGGYVLLVFKLKIFTVAGTMLISIGAYAFLWGWRFAVGFVALIFVHEMGHVLAARMQGLKVSAPMFIPFLGAYIALKEMPQNAWKEAQVALGGPLLGLAFTGFFLNLFNLLPIVPLDGGRAVGALHPAFWLLGLVGLGVLAWIYPNPIILVILVIGLLELWGRWRNRDHPAMRTYYQVTPAQRIAVGITYLGLAAICVLAMGQTHIEKDFGDV
jgi:Zn-dependent protease